MATENNPPPLTHVLETCLYVRDIQASRKFYEDVLNIKPFMQSVCPPFTPTMLGNCLR
jgi:predicted enzyme related to lactoylglutathione lyase